MLYWPCQRDAERTGDRQPVGSFGFSWVLIFISLSYFNAQHILFISRAISILRCHSNTAELTASFHCFLTQCFQHVRVSVLNMSVLLYLAVTEVLKKQQAQLNTTFCSKHSQTYTVSLKIQDIHHWCQFEFFCVWQIDALLRFGGKDIKHSCVRCK